jgi:large repetitive protein
LGVKLCAAGKALRRWFVLPLLLVPGLVWAADPQIASFTDTPDPVPAGGLYDYSVRIDNNDVDAALNTTLTLAVPAGATFVSASPSTANCVLQPSQTTVICTLGTFAGGGNSLDVTVRWRALGPGPATIASTATVAASNDSNNGNNQQTQTTSVISGANLALTKTGSPASVVGGSNVTYTLTASNAGPNASGNLVITDNLPPAVAFVSAAGNGWTCSHSAGVVTCTRPGPHAVGAAIPPVSIVGQVNASGGTVTNSATVLPATSGGIADPDTSDNTATANTTVLPGADVRIAQKRVSTPVPATAGSNVTFVIEPRNGGPAAAANVVVSDPLPAGWTFVSASGPNWTCGNTGNTVNCTRASMPAGASDDITVVATAPPNASVAPGGQVYTNTANISSATADPNSSNNSGSVNVQVRRDGADLNISKSKTPQIVAQGSNMTSTIIVGNNGPAAATWTAPNGPRVLELLDGESFISASGSGWTCDGSTAPRVTCQHSATSLAVGASLPPLTIITRADAAGVNRVSNTACTGSSFPPSAGYTGADTRPPNQGDPDPGNDCSTQSRTSTTVRPDLSISKTTTTPAGGDTVVSASEASVTYQLVVANVSPTPEAATGVVINDTVPAFINGRSSFGTITAVVSGGSTATFSCSNSNAAVTCTQTAGQLLQGQSVTVSIPVNRPLQEGTYTNTASVGNTAEGDPNSANNSASSPVTIAPIADVEMTGKSVTPGTVRAGEIATYVLSFRNNGPSPAAGVTLTDTFTFPGGDSGATVVGISSSTSGSTCSIAAGAVLNGASPSFNCTIGTLANGETQTVTLQLRPNFQAGNAARVFNNTVRVATTTPESPSGSDNGNNTRNATLNVSAAALDLLVNKTDRVGAVNLDPVPFFAGATFMGYQVSVTNNGPSYGTNVRITENMVPPAGKRVRFVCDVTSFGGSTCNAPSLCSVTNVTSGSGTAIPAFTCSVPAGNASTGAGVGELASGATKNIFLRFEALDQPLPTGDIFNNTATVSANEPDTQAANDSEGEQTTTRQRVDLRATKAASVASPNLFEPFNWVVTVVNNGPGNSLQTDVTDTLPAGTQVTGPITWTRTLQPASGTCTLSGLAVSCGLGQLDATGSATITIPVRIVSFPSGGTMSNSATIDTDPNKTGGIDIPGGNNTGTGSVTVQRSSLAGTVFEDRDRSGANAGTPQASGVEPRIAGVTLTLTGTDAYGNTVSRTTTTDASGNYLFNDLAPSNGSGYTITQTQPAGFDNSPAAPPTSGGSQPSLGGTYAAGGTAGNSSYSGVVVGASAAGTRYNFPELRRPTLAGFVYIDVNANGVRDAGTDTAIAGATVRLLDAGTGAVVATTTTAANGSYSFANLNPLITYTLEEPLPTTPTGLANGPVNPGQVGGAACASGCTAQPNTPSAGTDRIAAIDLSSGADGSNFNFGEVQQTFVAGTVFVDNNRNGALDGSETGRLGGVTLRLVQGADCTSGTTLQTTTTAADGSYRFDNVRAFQNYLVCETQPAGYGTGTANGTAGNVATINNLPAAGSPNNNFGETLASLSGSVYQDTGAGTPGNFNNGVRDTGEAGIANVPVTLTGTDVLGNTVNLTVLSDSNGNYLFEGLIAAGAAGYTITEGTIPPASGSFLDGRETAGNAGGSSTVNDSIGGINLGAGQQASGYLFGELPNAAITGTVYLDRNGSGTLDPAPTDGRLPGVTVRLVQGASCATGTVLQTTTTDAQGNYAFNNVAAGGSYLVCETQPSGYAQGSDNPGTNGSSGGANAIAISNLPATGSSGNHFGERAASLAGSVFVDFSPATPANTNNGTRDAGETGIAGVPVTLTGTDINGNPVSLSTTTDSNGNYSFGDLVQSDAAGYTVNEGAIPPGAGSFNDGQDRAGTAGGTAGNDSTSAIVLAAGNAASGYTFGELPIAPISGTVYIDRDRDNTLDPTPTDGRIPGVALTLVLGPNCSGTVVATTTTDASGNYTFSGASAGLTYTVCETQPVGYADGTGNSITISNLPAAGSPGNHFGERVGSIAGGVYLDANNDGTRQGSDAGIAGVQVTLTGTDAAGNPVNRTTTTDAQGNWRFDDLLAAGPGGYTVTEQAAQPVVGGVTTLNGRTGAGSTGGTPSAVGSTPSAVSGIPLAAGADSVNHQFGEILPVAVSGTVFIDINNNGAQDPPGDSGLGGVAIVITGTDDTGAPVTRNVTTAPDGSYSVPDLRPGTYTITEPTQPAGTTDGRTIAGSGGGTPTAPGSTPSAISAIVLTTPGTTSSGNNFAEIPNTSAISGRVWLDADNSGGINGSEAGISGVTIELSGTDAAGRPVSRTTTTDAQGDWRFDNLAPGNYTVREPNQPAGTLNGSTVPGSRGGSATPVGTTPSAISGINLGVGETSSANNFGEVPTSRIAGTVYADNNNNGTIDSGEGGLGGVTLVLTGTDDQGNPVNVTVVTGADGRYSFDNLRPGTYTVTQPTQPAGTVGGITTPGSLGGTATGPGTAPSVIGSIVLPPGGGAIDNNFGELANSPDLRVSKSLVGARFTVGLPASYTISVRNVGEVATTGSYSVSDRLPAGLTLAATPSGTGWSCVGAAGATGFTCTSNTVLASQATGADAITAPVVVAAAAAANSPLNNVVLVEGGGEIPARGPSAAERNAFNNNPAALPVCGSTPSDNACRTPTPVQLAAAVSGTVWHDVGSSSRLLDGGDRRLQGWQVEIVDPATGTVVGRATTAADGSYRVGDLLPGVPLAVRFREPGSGVVFGYPVNGEAAPGSSGASCLPNATLGQTSSCVGSGADPFLTVVLAPGQELVQQSLPVDPSGVVYDSGLRQPVPGSVVTLSPSGVCPAWNPATQLVGAGSGGYTINGASVSMTVGADGFYQYLFAPAAPASCTWQLAVTPPAGYTFQSTAIPPTAGPFAPGGGPGSVVPVQPQAGAPTGAVGPATTYYLNFTTGSGGPNIIHNHIPLDPFPPTAISLSKTGDKAQAEVGDSIRYTITVRVSAGPRPRQTTVVDRLPAGFTYIRGTAMVNDVPIADPSGGLGPTLAFNLGPMPTSGQLVLRYRVRVGTGAMQGDGINRARGHACGAPQGCTAPDGTPLAGSVPTNDAAFRVRVSGGVFTTDACVLGKIYVDCNNNHVQDPEELGIPGVRLFLHDGTTLVSDSEGKYSVCGVQPKSGVLKVDPITLPRGSRLTTSSNRNLGDAGSLWLDLKNGELHRADFVEGSCSNTVLEQVKARRAQGEVRAPESEKKGGPALRFDSKAHGKSTTSSPQQGTDGANQQAPKPRKPVPPPGGPVQDETNVPSHGLPMNRPPPKGRDSGTAPDVEGGAR